MATSIALFSNKRIGPRGMERVMTLLQGEADDWGWRVERDNRRVFVELATEYLPDISRELVADLFDVFGEAPATMISVVFDNTHEDRLEQRMARAIGMAFADHWPVAYYDYSNPPELLRAPGIKPSEN